MKMNDTERRFGAVTISVHWLTAGLIFTAMALGWSMDDGSGVAFRWHEWIGVAVLILVAFRIIWRLFNTMTQPPGDMPSWQTRAARLTHWGLLAVVGAISITGWMAVSATGDPVSLFGWFELPAIVPQSAAIGGAAEEIHEALVALLIGLLGVHVLAALVHHCINDDCTLRRMLGRPRWRVGRVRCLREGSV